MAQEPAPAAAPGHAHRRTLIGVTAALAYSLFSGWGVPAQRTVLMLATVAALQSLSLQLALAAGAADGGGGGDGGGPWALLQPGFCPASWRWGC